MAKGSVVRTDLVSHTPSDRWARLVLDALDDQDRIVTQDDWARCVRLSPRTLRNRCRAAGLRAKASLDFVRVLRVIVQAQEAPPIRFADALEDCDPRTIARLMRQSGVAESGEIPDLTTFLTKQAFVTHRGPIAALRLGLGA
jgi:hypothetical protein